MTRATMRALLRRRLNEVVVDQWQDTDLNDLLNYGLHQTQKEVMKIDPQAFIYLYTADIVNGRDLYDKPQGLWYEIEVALLDVASNSYSNVLRRKDYNVARTLQSADQPVYCNVGRFFGIYPIPSASVANGMRIMGVPTLEMTADSDVPQIHLGLHEAVVLWAQLLAIGETSEAAKDVKDVLANLLNDIPKFYFISGGEPEAFMPTIDKQY